ncbi:MAG: PilW family protein [Steroidobacteraceae bacterium]
MSTRLTLRGLAGRRARSQRGLSLIEMMVAILIALFLIGGVIVVEQGVNMTYSQQTGLSKLQDEERFAMSVLASVIGSAGYYPDPQKISQAQALPPAGSFVIGQAIYAPPTSYPTEPYDSIYVRYMTAAGDGMNLCDGTAAANSVYTSYLYVAPDTSGVGGDDLYCQLNGNTPVPLVNGVTNLQIFYGVATGTDNNVTEYLYANDVPNWSEVTSVEVLLTFANPLYPQPGQPQTVTFTRVISVMGRVGDSE